MVERQRFLSTAIARSATGCSMKFSARTTKFQPGPDGPARQNQARSAECGVNHCVSKKLVTKAKGTLISIALEDLQGIRDRDTVRKAQRRNLHGASDYIAAMNIAFRAVVSQPIVTRFFVQSQAPSFRVG
jgi:putative transposase